MGFMKSYKRLDNLCKDMNGIGITGYIADMEKVKNGHSYASNWNTDYRQLKHYRYIRNQIAHESYADEENMCSSSDTIWIEQFHQSILEQRDPLAVYWKAVNARQNPLSSATSIHKPTHQPSTCPKSHHSKRKPSNGNIKGLVISVVIILVVLFFFIFVL